MSCKMSASSGTSPQAGLMNNTDATHVYIEVDELSKVDGKSTDTDALDDDFWGGSGNMEGDAMAQLQSITSCTKAKGAVPTQEVAEGNIYAEVDYSKKKKSKKSKKVKFIHYFDINFCIHTTVLKVVMYIPKLVMGLCAAMIL